MVVRGMHEVPTSSTSVARTSASESERDDAGCDCVVILDPSPSSLSRPWQAWNDGGARSRADTAQQRQQEEQLRADAAGDLLAIAPTVALAFGIGSARAGAVPVGTAVAVVVDAVVALRALVGARRTLAASVRGMIDGAVAIVVDAVAAFLEHGRDADRPHEKVEIDCRA